MATIVGIRFQDGGKLYYFDAGNFSFKSGDHAIVETAAGQECGTVVMGNREMEDAAVVKPLKPVLRPATAEDVTRAESNAAREKEAMAVCSKKIAAHKLDMKLVRAQVAFDGSKILFYFSSEGRVDFRELVKDLAGTFHTRIELRQIGVRDEAKLLGGVGICGQPFCCARFLSDFQPVSIKMAKDQGLSLNPTKISGSCGRLMCCLKYEQDAYSALLKITPRQGAIVDTADGRGVVTEANLLTGMLKVRLDAAPDSPLVSVSRDQIKLIKDGKGGKMKPTADAPAAPEE